MISLIIENKEFFGIIISFLGIVLPLAILLITKNKEQKQINFEKFHNNLMRGLSNQDSKLGLDEQIAIIYELRNYPEYYPVIKRLLLFQRKRWESMLDKKPLFSNLVKEADETIKFMSKNSFIRYYIQYKNQYKLE